MTKLLKICSLIVFFNFCTSQLFAEEYILEPKYHVFNKRDNLLELGTKSNPYVVRDKSGKILLEVKPKYYDFNKRDNLMEPGSQLNPYVIEVK